MNQTDAFKQIKDDVVIVYPTPTPTATPAPSAEPTEPVDGTE